MIIIKNLTKHFNFQRNKKQVVLKDITLTLPDKGLIAVFGKSGSGKTTLLNIIGGLDKPSKGEIYIDGQNFLKHTDQIRNQKIGYVFQNFYLEENYSVYEILQNQMYITNNFDKTDTPFRINTLLDLVELADYKKRKPTSLSGGQQQRVAIARALMKAPSIILADEPTGNLDNATSIKIMSLLKMIAQEKLVILVSHEEELIKKYCDQVINLQDGLITQITPINNEATMPAHFSVLKKFAPSPTLKNGVLFTLKRKNIKSNFSLNYTYFLKLFFLLVNAIMLTIASALFNKAVNNNKFNHNYTNNLYYDLNYYEDCILTSNNPYRNVFLFDKEKSTSYFAFNNFTMINNINISYNKKIYTAEEKNFYGKDLKPGSVAITSKVLNEIVKKARLKNIKKEVFVDLLNLEDTFKIAFVIDNKKESIIYFNSIDYINFFKIYDFIQYEDSTKLFFNNKNNISSFRTNLALSSKDLNDDEAILLLNRNSAYKIVNDTNSLDLILEQTNQILKDSPKSLRISKSKLAIKEINLTTDDNLKSDFTLLVNQKVASNPLQFIKPNSNNNYYLEIIFHNQNEKEHFASALDNNNINTIDIGTLIKTLNQNYILENITNTYLLLAIVFLLLVIYYYIEKTDNIHENKMIAIFRVLGVNKGNIIYKRCLNVFLKNILPFLLFFILSALFITIKSHIDNIFTASLILYNMLFCLPVGLFLLIIPLLPIFKMLQNNPAKLIKRYDF